MKYFNPELYQELHQSVKDSALLNNKPAAPAAPAATPVQPDSTPRPRRRAP